MTTDALVEHRPASRATPASTSTWNDGVVPIDSALDRYRLDAGAIAAVDDQHRDRLRSATARSGTCCRPAADRCRRARRRARSASASVNCANDTDADACGATVDWLASRSRGRRSSSVTGTSLARLVALVGEAGGDRHALLARERRRARTRPTAPRGSRCLGRRPTTGVSVMPSGKCTSSEPLQPVFWKSLISDRLAPLAGSIGRGCSRASFSAGP